MPKNQLEEYFERVAEKHGIEEPMRYMPTVDSLVGKQSSPYPDEPCWLEDDEDYE